MATSQPTPDDVSDSALQRRNWRSRSRKWFSAIRDEPWPMPPLKQNPRPYVIAILLTIVAELAICIAATFWGTWADHKIDPIVMLAGAGATIFVCIRLFRRTESIADSPETAIVLILALSGFGWEALLCSTIGWLLYTLKQPIVAHLAISNLVQVSTLAIVVTTASDQMRPLLTHHRYGLWFAAALAMLFVVYATACAVVMVSVVAGGHGSIRTARSVLVRSTRDDAAMILLSILIASLLSSDIGHAMLWALIVPWLINFELASVNEGLFVARDQANSDPLTGLANRRGLAQHLDEHIATIDHSTCTSWVYVCDLDNFKQVNDTHGHEAGDHALVLAASAIRTAAQPDDYCARFGGDEFVVIANDRSTEQATAVGHDLCRGIAKTLGFLGVTVSIGVHRMRATDTSRSAINHADGAMYLSKERGANRITFSSLDSNLEMEPLREGSFASDVPDAQWPTAEDIEDDARTYWESILASSESDNDEYGMARALYQLYWISDGDAAKDCLKTARSLGEDTYGWSARAAAAQQFAEKNIRAAMASDARAVRFARAAGDWVLETVALLGMARSQSLGGDLESSIGLTLRAAHVATIHRNNDLVARSYERLIDLSLSNLQVETAIDQAMEFVVYAERVGDVELQVRALSLRARTLLQSGAISDAVHSFDSITSRLPQNQWPPGVVATYAEVLGAAGEATTHEIDRISHQAMEHRLDRTGNARLRGLWASIRFGGYAGGTHVHSIDEIHAEASMFAADRSSEFSEHVLWMARIGALTDNTQMVATAEQMVHENSSADIPPLTCARFTEVTAIVNAIQNRSYEALVSCANEWKLHGCSVDALMCQALVLVRLIERDRDEALSRLQHVHGALLRTGAGASAATLASFLTNVHRDAEEDPLDSLEGPLFTTLLPTDRQTMLAGVVRKRYKKGDVVTQPDSDVHQLTVVVEGLVSLYRDVVDGKRCTFELITAGDFYGEAAALGQPMRGLGAEALDDCDVIHIPVERISDLCLRIQPLNKLLIARMSDRMSRLEELTDRIANWTVPQRIAQLLLDLDVRFGHPTISGSRVINHQFTQEQLADMISATRKALVVAIADLRKKKIVSMRGRRFVIENRDALAAIVPQRRSDAA